MKVILLEINEVPLKVFQDFFHLPSSCKYKCDFIETYTYDKGELSPWISWESAHRGVYNDVHGINDINQDSSKADEVCPSIFAKALDQKFTVGLVNIMNSSAILRSIPIDCFSFFVPDAFSTSSLTKPYSLCNFQKVNLLMSRKSSRIVDKSIPKFPILIKGIFSFFSVVSSFRSLWKIIIQFFRELRSSFSSVRRRTIQSDIIFDVFYSLLKKNQPDLSVFFTNNVASSMHRFWEAAYPSDYPRQISPTDWIKTFQFEIQHAASSANDFSRILEEFVDLHPNTQLWIASSLGQQAVSSYQPQEFFWDITDLNAYISHCLGKTVKVSPLPQMVPIYSFEASSDIILDFIDFVSCSSGIVIRSKSKNMVAFRPDIETGIVSRNGERFVPSGMTKKVIDEKSSASAYHIPKGILYRYGDNLVPYDSSCINQHGHLGLASLHDLLLRTLSTNS